MTKPPTPTITPPTPHISLTSPAAGATFVGGAQPDLIAVNGSVWLTCDDPGGDCGVGRISGVTVKVGSAEARAATLSLDHSPASGTEQSGTWHFSGTPAPTDADATRIVATLSMSEQPHHTATASSSVVVNIKNGSHQPSCADLDAELADVLARLAKAVDPELDADLRAKKIALENQLKAEGCVPITPILSGTATIITDFQGIGGIVGPLTGPFTKNVDLALSFDGDTFTMTPFAISLKKSFTASIEGETGHIDRASGAMTIPIKVQGNGPDDITLNLVFNMTTEKGDAHGPFNPQGVRLAADGSVTLAGAAFDTVVTQGVNVQLVIVGTISPLPPATP